MSQEEKLLSLFKELYEKQDAIAKYHQDPSLHEYSFSDLHCIDAVGSLERPNVTNIAASLNMTRGAVSKITKRLTAKKLLLPYSLEGNKKEVCFSLTEEGQRIFAAHREGHLAWEQRDLAFFRAYPAEQLSEVVRFLEAFDQHLKSYLEE